jgi:2-keto-3-deoxy-L-rhamnonate aldolase RhmA
MVRRTLVFAAAAVCAVGLTMARPQAGQGAAQAPARAPGVGYTVLDPSKIQGWATKDYLFNILGWDQKKPLWNKAKQKLLDGKQLFSFTAQTVPVDPEWYCQMAPHYDFVWIEMQHSALTWTDVSRLIEACPSPNNAVPFVRLPDEFESTIQHATDLGAMGIVEPTVDTVEKAEATAKYARFPPYGRRSTGHQRGAALYGPNYREEFNANMLVVIMCETPTCAANIYDIARVPGIDVVMAANSDLNNFSGFDAGTPQYEEYVTKIHDGTIKAGKFLGSTSAAYATGGPGGRKDFADFRFFQNGPAPDGFKPPTPPRDSAFPPVSGAAPAPAQGGRGAAPSAPGGGRGATPSAPGGGR